VPAVRRSTLVSSSRIEVRLILGAAEAGAVTPSPQAASSLRA
jgi:hypothetical protein